MAQKLYNMKAEVKQLAEMIASSSSIVFFGGAGVSTESGIPDFRSATGLYHQEFPYPPEVMISREFFESNTEEFYRFYRKKMIHPNVKPNLAHLALAKLEAAGKLKAVITQNIDGLHQAAGSKNVLELHGSVYRNFCIGCKTPHSVEIIGETGVPTCNCGNTVKPDVVLYGEQLNEDTIAKAVQHIAEADMLIVGGTSLSVYPAAGFLNYFQGSKLVLLNKTKTPYDKYATLVIRDSIGQVLGEIHTHCSLF